MLDLPKGMKIEHQCVECKNLMEIDSAFLRKDESAVEVWYKCECNATFGYAYTNGFIKQFKISIGEDVTHKPGETISAQSVAVE